MIRRTHGKRFNYFATLFCDTKYIKQFNWIYHDLTIYVFTIYDFIYILPCTCTLTTATATQCGLLTEGCMQFELNCKYCTLLKNVIFLVNTIHTPHLFLVIYSCTQRSNSKQAKFYGIYLFMHGWGWVEWAVLIQRQTIIAFIY